jgi:hypothetical protein
MRSRRKGEPILQTYGEGNGRGRAGDCGAVWSMLGDGEGGLRRCSGFEEQLYSFALLPSSSSLGQLLRMLIKFNEYRQLFIGLLDPTCRGDGVLQFLYTNQTLTRLCLGDFWKGMDLG